MRTNIFRLCGTGVVVGLLALGGCRQQADTEPATVAGGTSSAAEAHAEEMVQHIQGMDQFKSDVLGSEKLVLVDFYADWCPPCRALGPVVAGLASERPEDIVVAKVNVDKNRDVAEQYNVSGIPHMVLMRGGKVVDTRTGFAERDALDKWIDSHQTMQ